MSDQRVFFSIAAIKDKFKNSKLLPILVKIFVATNGLREKSSVRLSGEEKILLINECKNKGFEPAWSLMTCLGTLFPDVDEILARDKFKKATGLEISVIINQFFALIKINTC